ncbi:YcgL domain-containing protein [sulfur-oxidizing endosymbiont of Gigantopelta aegis]|uniref:YcgL domain-containing protein n=1 Tax=sulfur-oxidizing endosymbiont of Gigantopelta aegis TaxID=2794934 RepID=UPI0018DE640B|nr:YcgL domain-containing protein [sulfur-oxidizing endosymbiont of Gigantopelta aegis]
MKTVIYKGHKKQDSYLYLEQEDDFSRVPEILLTSLGQLELVMTIELNQDKKLAQADAVRVMASLTEDGFYLQMPSESERLALSGKKPVSNPIPSL